MPARDPTVTAKLKFHLPALLARRLKDLIPRIDAFVQDQTAGHDGRTPTWQSGPQGERHAKLLELLALIHELSVEVLETYEERICEMHTSKPEERHRAPYYWTRPHLRPRPKLDGGDSDREG